MYLSAQQVSGHLVSLTGTDPRHLGVPGTPSADTPVESFGKLFTQALGAVNSQQLDTMQLSQQMITDPDSVDIHDITIAMAEANLSLSMTKAIVDGAIKAYREIIAVR